MTFSDSERGPAVQPTEMNKLQITAYILLAILHASSAQGAERPNILLLLTDDQVYHSMGYTGNEQVRTPNLDRLAADGLIFDAAYDTTSICMPSRASIMTGMYEYKTGCNFSHGPLLREKWTRSYPVLLRDAGYHTGFIGKFGFAVKEPGGDSSYHDNEDLPIDSFDEWYGWPGQGYYDTARNQFVAHKAESYPHVTRAVGAVAQDFIKTARKHETPFCLSVSFKAPHGPMSPDPFFDDVYADTVWQKSPNYDESGAAHVPEQAKSGRQYLHIHDFRPDKYQATMRKYHQLIHGIDYAVGMIREELHRQGLADNTVILFLTDNGYNCGAHGFGGKVLPYEEGSRSPMILHDPRHPISGTEQRSRAVVGNIDMAPTILELAGLPVPPNMDGRSLLPLLDDPAGRVRDSLLLINAWGNAPTHAMGIVTEDYKYIHWPYAQDMSPKDELYHLTSDRYEMDNLANNPDMQEILASMQALYDGAVTSWGNECVNHSGYPQYAAIFDRTLSWEQKLAAMEPRTRKKFGDWRAADNKLASDGTRQDVSPEKKAAKAAARAKRKAEREQTN
jgi:arylsulfatase A-like enzyme